MGTLVITAQVDSDHRLVVDLPLDLPIGAQLKVVISQDESQNEVQLPINWAREAARAKLLAAGALVTDIHAPENTPRLSDDEIRRLGQLAPGARSSEELIAEDRG